MEERRGERNGTRYYMEGWGGEAWIGGVESEVNGSGRGEWVGVLGVCGDGEQVEGHTDMGQRRSKGHGVEVRGWEEGRGGGEQAGAREKERGREKWIFFFSLLFFFIVFFLIQGMVWYLKGRWE